MFERILLVVERVVLGVDPRDLNCEDCGKLVHRCRCEEEGR
jgi:hypothetical protein